jgi:hypothetical protein
VTADIDIFLPSGHPGADQTQLATVGITLDPIFLGVNPKFGSFGGSQIVADVRGLGPKSTAVTLVTSEGIDICNTVSIPKYGQLLCLTKEGLIFPEINTLSLKVGDAVITCVPNTADGNCEYYAASSSGFPVVT